MTARCDICGEDGITNSQQVQTFQYGAGEDLAMLTATVKVFDCASCGEAYTGEEAEIARHEAVQAHLNSLVLAPS